MVIVLLDDRTVATFESPDRPPNWLEWTDVANGEYEFCDDRGQRYSGRLIKIASIFSHEQWCLEPVGAPNPQLLQDMLATAVDVDHEHCAFADLESLAAALASPRKGE